jgi:hypothetical protein
MDDATDEDLVQGDALDIKRKPRAVKQKDENAWEMVGRYSCLWSEVKLQDVMMTRIIECRRLQISVLSTLDCRCLEWRRCTAGNASLVAIGVGDVFGRVWRECVEGACGGSIVEDGVGDGGESETDSAVGTTESCF